MTLLTVWDENNASTPELQTRDAAVITEVLGTLGARFSRWELKELSAEVTLTPACPQPTVEVEGISVAQPVTAAIQFTG